MKILIVGTGALGSYFGGLLARTEDVFFVARGQQLETIRSDGLKVIPLEGDSFQLDVRIDTAPPPSETYNLILVTVKSYGIPEVLEMVSAATHNNTVILPLQNGMISIDRLISQVDASRVYGAISWVNAAIESPGCVRQRVPGKMIFGQLNGGISETGDKIRNLFEASAIEVELHDDIYKELWRKFIFICAVNGMTAYTRMPVGNILSGPKNRELFVRIMHEVEEIGRTRALFPENTVCNIINYLENEVASDVLNNMLGSMYFDLINERRLELDALNGWVVSEGRKLGIATHVNEEIYQSLKPHINGR